MVRSVGHDQELTLVDHLDELRTRLILSLIVVGVAFGFCFWQNGRLLHIINAPLAHQTTQQIRSGNGPLGQNYTTQRSARDLAVQVKSLVTVVRSDDKTSAARSALDQIGTAVSRDIRRLSEAPQGDRPITLGLSEPFSTTVTVAAIFALILSLPVLLVQAYNFLMPAVDPSVRRRTRPLLVAIPGLFLAGVAFGYFVVLPAAVHFLQNFNSGQFDVLVQASLYYSFAAKLLLAMRRRLRGPGASGGSDPGGGRSIRVSFDAVAATRSPPAPPLAPSSQAMRSRCCLRPFLCICCSSSASPSQHSRSDGSAAMARNVLAVE